MFIASVSRPPPSHRVSSFVDEQVAYDRMFEPFTRPLLDAAGLSNGDRVLDIGCGAGTTTLLAADRVTPGGLAIGVDVEPDAIGRARQRAQGARRHQASFVLADAGVHAFEPGRADAVISRFGTLHFSDPEAAFANLRGATRAGGRLAILCARPLADNLWAQLPLLILRRYHAEAGALALARGWGIGSVRGCARRGLGARGGVCHARAPERGPCANARGEHGRARRGARVQR